MPTQRLLWITDEMAAAFRPVPLPPGYAGFDIHLVRGASSRSLLTDLALVDGTRFVPASVVSVRIGACRDPRYGGCSTVSSPLRPSRRRSPASSATASIGRIRGPRAPGWPGGSSCHTLATIRTRPSSACTSPRRRSACTASRLRSAAGSISSVGPARTVRSPGTWAANAAAAAAPSWPQNRIHSRLVLGSRWPSRSSAPVIASSMPCSASVAASCSTSRSHSSAASGRSQRGAPARRAPRPRCRARACLRAPAPRR